MGEGGMGWSTSSFGEFRISRYFTTAVCSYRGRESFLKSPSASLRSRLWTPLCPPWVKESRAGEGVLKGAWAQVSLAKSQGIRPIYKKIRNNWKMKLRTKRFSITENSGHWGWTQAEWSPRAQVSWRESHRVSLGAHRPEGWAGLPGPCWMRSRAAGVNALAHWCPTEGRSGGLHLRAAPVGPWPLPALPQPLGGSPGGSPQ